MIYYVTKPLRASVKRKNNPYSANTLTLGTTVNQTIEQKCVENANRGVSNT